MRKEFFAFFEELNEVFTGGEGIGFGLAFGLEGFDFFAFFKFEKSFAEEVGAVACGLERET